MSMSPDTASFVLTLPMASRYFPTDTKAMIMAAESNVRWSAIPVSPPNTDNVQYVP